MGNIYEPNCLRCQTKMEIGAMLDRSFGAVQEQAWVQGLPDKTWTGTLKLSADPENYLPVRTFRCPNCGYLESYVPRATDASGQ